MIPPAETIDQARERNKRTEPLTADQERQVAALLSADQPQTAPVEQAS